MSQSLLDVKQLSHVLNVPVSWIYSRTRETGQEAMPRIKVGKYCRFKLNDVMEWLEKQNENFM